MPGLWQWDQAKDRANRRKHGLPLAAGIHVLADPLALHRPDPRPDGDRWQAVGSPGAAQVLLFVVQADGEPARPGASSASAGPRHGSAGPKDKTMDKAVATPAEPMAPEVRAAIEAAGRLPDSAIDLTDPDAPEVTDWSGAVRGGFVPKLPGQPGR